MTHTLAGNASVAELELDMPSLSLNDRLSLIGLIDEGARAGCEKSPIVADLFEKLGDLVGSTVRGAKIDRLNPERRGNAFRVFEINSTTGENLGRLNMLYLNKPIPSYYLVYVEVAPPFRNKGLGNLVLTAFRDFVSEKSALGILDNIIPPDDPTYDIYVKLGWRPVSEITNSSETDAESFYMVFIPPGAAGRDLKDPLLKLLHHLRRKRPAIDMKDNELMVERTIEEFKDLYSALLTYFGAEIDKGEPTSLMRFMFTRFVTKLIGFRRRIGQLLGYTGGESLQQIVVHPEIRSLLAQSYAPREMAGTPAPEFGDKELWLNLPDELKTFPARTIEAQPNYRRPNLVAWLEQTGRSFSDPLTIGDLLDLGFDPTRLKEFSFNGVDYIIERVQARMLPRLDRKRALLSRLGSELAGARMRSAMAEANPPLLAIRDRGNGYVLRRKVEGVHWEEAIEQLQTVPRLQALSKEMRLERITVATVRKTVDWLSERVTEDERPILDDLAYFVAWDLAGNQPKVSVDFSGSSLQAIWVA